MLDTIGAGLFSVSDNVAVHPPVPVTVTVYVPAGRPLINDVVWPVFQLYVLPPDPPLTDTLIAPLLSLLHTTLVTVALSDSADPV